MRAYTAVILALTISNIGVAQGTSFGFGAAVGHLKFADGGYESAMGATASARFADLIDVWVNPTWARATSAASGSIPARTVSGFTDLPVSVGVSRGFAGAWSPSFGVSLGATLPTGDTAALGSGRTAFGANASAGIAYGDAWASAAVSRSLSNGYSAGLASAAPTSLSLSAGKSIDALRFSASVYGDVGTTPNGYTLARSLAVGFAAPVSAAVSFNLDASAGLSSGSPAWAVSAGFGTTPAGVVAASIAPYQRLNKAFGAGAKVKAKPFKP